MPVGELPWYAQRVWRWQQGSINWSVVAALAACVTASAALVVALAVVWQVRQQSAQQAFNATLDALWHFDEQWNSDGMLDARSAAAGALLEGRPARDIDDVLDFFDQIALLVQRGALDPDMVCYEFYWPMTNYWFASRDYVGQVRRDDPGAWQQFENLLPRLTEVEMRRRKRTAAEATPTKAQIGQFLNAEVQNGECAEDDADAQKVPL